MKKFFTKLLCASVLGCTAACLTAGCARIANPWHYFDSLAEAEAYAGYEFGAAAEIGSYEAFRFSVMDNENPMIQVDYKLGEQEITVRKQAGEGRDISGVYGLDTVTAGTIGGLTVTVRTNDQTGSNATVLLFDFDGCSWAIYAPQGFGGTEEAFVTAVTGK